MRQIAILDIDGLVTYPSFREAILTPLENRGLEIRFWSAHPFPDLMLKKHGLPEYAASALGSHDWGRLPIRMDQLGGLDEEQKLNAFESASFGFCHKTNTDVETAFRKTQEWVELIRRLDNTQFI